MLLFLRSIFSKREAGESIQKRNVVNTKPFRKEKNSDQNVNKMVGLLGASTPAGGSVEGSEKLDLIIHFIAWRDGEGEINKQELRCLMRIEKDDLHSYWSKLFEYQIIQITNYKFIDKETLTFEKINNYNAVDKELKKIAEKHQAPILKNHSTFGKMEYDRKYDWYKATIDWLEQDIEINLHCSKPEDYETISTIAMKFYDDAKVWNAKAINKAVSELLDLSNGEWLEEGAAKVSEKEFIERLTLGSIGFYDGSSFEMWFEIDNLFTDHGVLVSGNLETGVEHATLA